MGVEPEAIEQEYRSHHEHWGGWGFVFCGPDRIPLLREWVGGPGLRVLDLGCRDGALSRAFLAGNRIVGVDIDRVALARASQLGVETVWADLDQPLPFEDASFDVVVIAEVLEHLRFPENVIAEAKRVLVPGGTLIGSVPNCYRLKSRLRFLLGHPPERDPTLLRMFRPTDLTNALEKFEEVELKFLAGRFVSLHSRLFANDIAFRARTPHRMTTRRPAPGSAGRDVAETNTLDELLETRQRIHALLAARTPSESEELGGLVERHDDLLARLNEESILPVAWEDDWSPPRPRQSRDRTQALRLQIAAAAISALALVICLFALLPEALGDKPYNVF